MPHFSISIVISWISCFLPYFCNYSINTSGRRRKKKREKEEKREKKEKGGEKRERKKGGNKRGKKEKKKRMRHDGQTSNWCSFFNFLCLTFLFLLSYILLYLIVLVSLFNDVMTNVYKFFKM